MTLYFLLIAGDMYQCSPLAPDPSVAKKAWRLTKLYSEKGDRASHDVHLDRFGWHCDCPDQLWRKDKTGELCKHATSLKEFVQ